MGTSTSILCICQNPAILLKQQFKIDIDKPDADTYLVTSETSIGIDQIRDLNSFTKVAPMQADHKTVVILQAHTLTIEAQNALLKLLEEPPVYVQLILCAPHTQSFLDTILSRCQILRDTTHRDLVPRTSYLVPILQTAPPARLVLVPSDAKTAEGATTFCHSLIHEAEQIMQTQPTQSAAHNLSLLSDCLSHLAANANPTLTLTDTILQLK